MRVSSSNIGYSDFLAAKAIRQQATGFSADPPPFLYGWQRQIVRWALNKGKAALFEECGLGKTEQQLAWAHAVQRHTAGRVLIVAPLCVSFQTSEKAAAYGMQCSVVRGMDHITAGLNIANYDMLHAFDPSAFSGIVLDESSILKAFDGATRKMLIDFAKNIPYRLCCSATPAPNDYQEIGNHAEFLGIMSRLEMLANWFRHDSDGGSRWILKQHASADYWRWIGSWACVVADPRVIDGAADGFSLPKLLHHFHYTDAGKAVAQTLVHRIAARASTAMVRAQDCAGVINASKAQWIAWCSLNTEADHLRELITDAEEIRGTDSRESKEDRLHRFTDGSIRVLITKPSIAGFGMNWQRVNHVAFVGLTDSYEQYYQAVRRCWRYMQKHDVHCHIFCDRSQRSTLDLIEEKNAKHHAFYKEMSAMNECANSASKNVSRVEKKIADMQVVNGTWSMFCEDCIEGMEKLPEGSVHHSIFSPPFADLFVYSDSPRDIGNVRSYGEFFEHFRFVVTGLRRVMMPGRIVAVHCMDVPQMKYKTGVIQNYDFPGDIIREFKKQNFLYHGRITIWKDPLIEATRTKALGLMHKQIQKDSTMCRPGLPDYLVAFRVPGENPEPVCRPSGFERFIGAPHENPKKDGIEYSHMVWRKYASPVWSDIRQMHTLNAKIARDSKDEKHMCPLQLDTIARSIELWTNPGDLVLSPFAGVGSEGYVALSMGRKFVGYELKECYWRQAVKYLESATASAAAGGEDVAHKRPISSTIARSKAADKLRQLAHK